MHNLFTNMCLCFQLKNLRESNLQLIPHELRDTLKLLLHATPGLRPTASECAKVAYFDDVGARTLANLDAQFQWDNLQKSQFYKGLPQVLPRLPHRVSVHRYVNNLQKKFEICFFLLFHRLFYLLFFQGCSMFSQGICESSYGAICFTFSFDNCRRSVTKRFC